MDTLQSLHNILRAESEAVAAIPVTAAYLTAIDLIVEHVHRRGGKLVTSGMGKAGQIAVNIATTFASTGTPAVNIHPVDAQHGDLGVLQPNDVLILISNSGRTAEINDLMSYARNIVPDIPVIVIVGDPESRLAKNADVALVTAPAREVGPMELTPTTSITMMTVIGHMLVVEVMKRINFTREEYAKRHRGGTLGEKLRN